MKKILIVACFLSMYAGDVLGRTPATLPVITNDGTQAFAVPVTDKGGNVYYLNLVDKDTKEKKNNSSRGLLDGSIDVVEGSLYLSRIAFGTTVLAGSSLIKGACWAVNVSPLFYPGIAASVYHNKVYDFIGERLVKEFVPSSIIRGMKAVCDGISFTKNKISEVKEGVFTAVNSFLSWNLFETKRLREEFCKKLASEGVNDTVLEKLGCKEFLGAEFSKISGLFKPVNAGAYSYIGWLGSIAINYYAQPIIKFGHAFSSSGIRFGKSQISKGFEELKELRQYCKYN